MTILDAYALISFLRDESAAGAVESLLRAGDCAINAVNLAETIDQLTRIHHVDASEIAAALSGLIGGPLVINEVDEAMAWRSAAIRTRHYHRKERPLSLADCFLIASAEPDDVIATADEVVASVARSEGIDVHKLRDRGS